MITTSLLTQKVPDPAQEHIRYLDSWFTTHDGFEGVCVVDRGTGSSRLVELQSHLGIIRVTTIDGITPIQEPPKPEKLLVPVVDLGEPEVGDRVTWTGAPSWWNPDGERLLEIRGSYGWVDYWRSPIPHEQLRVVTRANVAVHL